MYYIKEMYIYMCLYSVDGEATTGIITDHFEDHTNRPMFHKSDVLFLKMFSFIGCVMRVFRREPCSVISGNFV